MIPGDRIEIAKTVFLLTSSICEIEGASLDASMHDTDKTTAVGNMHQPNDNESNEHESQNPDRPT